MDSSLSAGSHAVRLWHMISPLKALSLPSLQEAIYPQHADSLLHYFQFFWFYYISVYLIYSAIVETVKNGSCDRAS